MQFFVGVEMNIISKKNRHFLFQRTIDAWGINAQILTAAEECCELAHASIQLITRSYTDARFEHFCEEFADVTIMMEQLRYIFCKELGGEDKFNRCVGGFISFKLNRLVERLDRSEAITLKEEER